MNPENPAHARRIKKLLDRLGYHPEAGWIDANEFSGLTGHRFAMQQARDEMGVIGAFCLRREANHTESVATPLVYVASAVGSTDAQDIHRKVWSQGLVPFLLILTPQQILLCTGFSYVHSNWNHSVKLFDWATLDQLPLGPTEAVTLGDLSGELWDLRAIRLRTSLFWRDHSIDVAGRVDRSLLENLKTLSGALTGKESLHRLTYQAANGLIGRFLYVFFLADRGFIDPEWLSLRNHEGINLDAQYSDWPADATWKFFDDLDSIFNGSIFPLGEEERSQIGEYHINFVRQAMKYGKPTPSGAVQTSFLKFYFGALRTETLSAVYEQFLENIDEVYRRRKGAFYTPPFLVDFMLDRVNEENVIKDGMTVLDPAAGSGVFLVGFYRRIIEHVLASKPNRELNLGALRSLLLNNIYGIEENSDACHVAAFSLYLTMLDYVTPRDRKRAAAGKDPKKLFPPLVGTNIISEDFFSDKEKFPGLPALVHCVVGNPPWQDLKTLESKKAMEWHKNNKDCAPIGSNQAAELFTWKVLREHLADDGVLSFLLPAQSFLNSTSNKFRNRLVRDFRVLGAANFSHFRYRLFGLPGSRNKSRHSAGVIFVRKCPSASQDQIWVYAPLLVGQPLARSAWPWTILLDRAEIQVFRQAQMSRNSQSWFEAFLLRPVDRQIRYFLQDRVSQGEIAFLGDFCKLIGAKLGRGKGEKDTGVDSRYLNGAPDRRNQRGQLSKEDICQYAKLPSDQLQKVKPTYRQKFGGNILLVPKNFTSIKFIDYPTGFNESIHAIYFSKSKKKITKQEKRVLQGLDRFLNSDMAQYLATITGRRWQLDGRTFDLDDLKSFPLPFTGMADPRLEKLLALEGEKLEKHLVHSFGLDGGFERAIKEFLDFRIGFRDGGVPPNAAEQPEDEMIRAYRNVLQQNLDGQLGRRGAFVVASATNPVVGVGAVAARYLEESEDSSGGENETVEDCRNALQHYIVSSANSFCDSLSATYDAKTESVSFVKPLEYFRWTIESAFTDSRQMLDAFLSGRS